MVKSFTGLSQRKRPDRVLGDFTRSRGSRAGRNVRLRREKHIGHAKTSFMAKFFESFFFGRGMEL